MSRQKMTIFAILGGVRRCGGQAFFDKCLSTCNCMAASSYLPPVLDIKSGGFEIKTTANSKFLGMINVCPAAFFSFLPLGRLGFY
ncbi:hypothetical protein [Parablautia muri]|uniref:Uncharacterized protein n=1 Tax=Parablautia muri TaxID=2320879 RepID=A0A9X5BJT4_9FIRM|nr:hypothetical protein [Parablautia muri]NBJ95370.1 hypothetical protein [Parablautia muri]